MSEIGEARKLEIGRFFLMAKAIDGHNIAMRKACAEFDISEEQVLEFAALAEDSYRDR